MKYTIMETETSVLPRQRDPVSWCWKVTKRRLGSDAVLFEDGDIHCKLCSKYIPIDVKIELETKRVQEFPCGIASCKQKFYSVLKYETHYSTCHRNVCQTCHRILPSSYLLELHLLETHDSMFALLAEKQDMYQCLVENCDMKFKDTCKRRDHMIKVHKYPSNYRYDRSQRKRTPKSQSKPVLREAVDNIQMDVETSSDNTNPSSSSGRVFSYKVPKNITFGSGVSRGFLGGRGRGRGKQSKKKHWHNVNKMDDQDTTVEIENVDMSELSDALT